MVTEEQIITALFIVVLCFGAEIARLRWKLRRVTQWDESRWGRLINNSTDVVK